MQLLGFFFELAIDRRIKRRDFHALDRLTRHPGDSAFDGVNLGRGQARDFDFVISVGLAGGGSLTPKLSPGLDPGSMLSGVHGCRVKPGIQGG